MKGLPGCDDLMSSRCGTLYYMGKAINKAGSISHVMINKIIVVCMTSLLCVRTHTHVSVCV